VAAEDAEGVVDGVRKAHRLNRSRMGSSNPATHRVVVMDRRQNGSIVLR